MRYTFLFFILLVFKSDIVPSKTGSRVSQKDAQIALDFHNKVRKEVGVSNLEWSVELAGYAQEWANHLADSCNMQHRPRSGKWAQRFGENIFWGSSGDIYNVKDACESWYSEKADFSGPIFTGKEASVVGHYTQMVWRSTKRMGIGVARCKSGGIIVVANYDPAGNYLGQNAY